MSIWDARVMHLSFVRSYSVLTCRPPSLSWSDGRKCAFTPWSNSKMKKLAILTNTIAPYRLQLYLALSESAKTVVFHGGNEQNRDWELIVPPGLRIQKVKTIQVPLRKRTGIDGISDISYKHLNIGLLWTLPRFRPDVILTNEMGIRTGIALLYGRLAHVPVWVWWGGTTHSERNIGALKKRIRAVLVSVVERWVSYGATSTEYLESIGVPRRRILQIQNCVPQEQFLAAPSPEKAWFADDPRPVIVTVGQLIPRKGVDKLIEACGRLAAEGRKFTLVAIGKGAERDRLIQLAKECGVENFHLLPNQSQQTLNEIYRAADVFVFPTLEDSWGLVVNEAMWAGLPVLCSKYAGCAPELIPESDIFDPMSPANFDAALAKIFDGSLSPPDRSRLRTWQEVSDLLCRAILEDRPDCQFQDIQEKARRSASATNTELV